MRRFLITYQRCNNNNDNNFTLRERKIYRNNRHVFRNLDQKLSKVIQFRNCYPLNATDQFVSLKNTVSLSLLELQPRFRHPRRPIRKYRSHNTAGNRTTILPTHLVRNVSETRYPIDNEIFNDQRFDQIFWNISCNISRLVLRGGQGRNVFRFWYISFVGCVYVYRYNNS